MRKVTWYIEYWREEKTVAESTAHTIVLLRRREGFWGEISRHASENAARVAAARWRERWRRGPDSSEFRARVVKMYPTEDKPFALLLSYKPHAVKEIIDAEVEDV